MSTIDQSTLGVAIAFRDLTKTYRIYDKPSFRMREALSPRGKKYHRDFNALEGLTATVGVGESIGVVGKNGSGKSTLLKLLTGVLSPTMGELEVHGRISALLELGAGFDLEISGLDNLYFNGSVMGYSRQQMDTLVPSIIEFADLGEFIHHPVKTYSSGMFVRLAFSLAITVDPDILIIDEALSVGDVRFQLKCYRRLEEFKKSGKTIFFVSHSTADVVRLCERAIWLDDGKIRMDGPAKAVTEAYYSWIMHDAPLLGAESGTEGSASPGPKLNLVPIPENATMVGEGGCRISGVGLFDETGNLVTVLRGPTKLKIVFSIEAQRQIDVPYVGLHVCTAQGHMLFGINNHVMGYRYDPVAPNETLNVVIEFCLPELVNGDYVLGVGVNDGTMDTHTRLVNIVDAYLFAFDSKSQYQRQIHLVKLHDYQFSTC